MSRFLPPLLLLLLSCSTSLPPAAGRESASHAGEAAELFALKREGSDDRHGSYDAARASMRTMAHYSTATDTLLGEHDVATEADDRLLGRWKFLGPGNIGGRTRALIIDPVEPHVMYAAGVSGGIWKSLSGGGRWEPIGDDLVNIAVNSLAQNPVDRRVVYAGTGEGYLREEVRGTALPLRGNGIFMTRDAGATWSQLPATATPDFHWVNDLAVSAHDPRRIYAATRTGVWRSRDEGGSWTRVLETNVMGGCLDLAARSDADGDFLFASCGSFEQATVYRNLNASGSTEWEAVLREPNMGRTTLAIAPSDPSIIYALSASNEPGLFYQGLLAVWRSNAQGDAGSWQAQVRNDTKTDSLAPWLLTNLSTVSPAICFNIASQPFTMGWYTNTIAVDPADPERVWIGGVDLHRSDDGGRTWGLASYWWSNPSLSPPYVHADQHAIVFHPRYDGVGNTTVFFANDGGVSRSDNARAFVPKGRSAICRDRYSEVEFEELNRNYGVTQFYHGAVFADGRRFIGGTQDNGTIIGSTEDGSDGWVRPLGGDGGYVALSQRDPSLIYAETQGGRVFRSTNGGRTFRTFHEGLIGEFLFISPLALDPEERLWIGGRHLWRYHHADQNEWRHASVELPSPVSALAFMPGDANRMLAGTAAGHILRSDSASTADATTTWSQVQPRAGFVSSITYDPVDPNVTYATYAGFGGTHVWRSLDGGMSWSHLDGSGKGKLPDIPVHSLAVDPTRRDRLYLGTDLGMFVSLDGGASWAVEESGYGAAITESVVIGAGANGPAVYAFTHGRGVWRAELTVTGPRRRAVR